jgi:hypothetical protein
MAEEKTSAGSIAKFIAWPLVAVAALLLFQNQIATVLPDEAGKISIGNLTIEKDSKLGTSASPDVLTALKDLPPNANFQLISRNLAVTCFWPPVVPASARADHSLLIERGLLKELSAAEIKAECQNPASNVGFRLTPLGDRARTFQLNLLAELAQARAAGDSASASK